MIVNKTISLLCILFTFALADITTGLKGYWKFDESSGTTAYDSSGKGNNGILNNGPSRISGYKGNALSFDGSNDIVTVTHSSNLAFMASSFTVCAWVFIDSSTNTGIRPIIRKDANIPNVYNDANRRGFSFATSASGSTWSCGPYEPGHPVFALVKGDNDLNPRAVSSKALSSGWHLMVGMFDTDVDSIFLYIDGVKDTSVYAPIDCSMENDSNLEIGGLVTGGDCESFFNNKIDEVRVYDRALTSQEVCELSGMSECFDPSQGLLAHYEFNGNANDASGNNYNGTLNGAIVTTDRCDETNKALNFDGIDDNIELGQQINLGTSDFTLSALIKPNVIDTSCRHIITKGLTSTGTPSEVGFGLLFMNGKLCFFVNGSIPKTGISGVTIPVDEWSYVTGVRDGHNLYLYVNGVLVGTATDPVVTNTNSNIPLNIGSASFTEAPYRRYFFNGKIDDIRIYNRALSGQEISKLSEIHECIFNPSQGLLAHYPFNGNANDVSGNSLSGTVNGATPALSKSGTQNGALSFDGTDDNVELGQSINFGTNNFTLCALVKPNFINSTGYHHILTKGVTSSGVPSEVGYSLMIRTGKLCFFVFGGEPKRGVMDIAIPVNEWSFITAVRNGTKLSVYMNGVLVGTAIDSYLTNTNSNLPLNFASGAYGDSPTRRYFFNGVLDEIRVYNQALEAWQIHELAEIYGY